MGIRWRRNRPSDDDVDVTVIRAGSVVTHTDANGQTCLGRNSGCSSLLVHASAAKCECNAPTIEQWLAAQRTACAASVLEHWRHSRWRENRPCASYRRHGDRLRVCHSASARQPHTGCVAFAACGATAGHSAGDATEDVHSAVARAPAGCVVDDESAASARTVVGGAAELLSGSMQEIHGTVCSAPSMGQ